MPFQNSNRADFCKKKKKKMVYSFNGYKIEGILLRTQNFYMTIVHTHTLQSSLTR